MAEGLLATSRCVPSEMTLTGALARTSTLTLWLAYTTLPRTCTCTPTTGGATEPDARLSTGGKLGSPRPAPVRHQRQLQASGAALADALSTPTATSATTSVPRPAGGRLRGRHQASPSGTSAASGVLGPAHSRASEAGAQGPPNPLRPQFPCCWVLVTCLCLSLVFSPQTCYGLRKTQTCVRVRSSRP